MSEPVAGAPAATAPAATAPAGGLPAEPVGCCGKIPARGDFIRLGLPRDFVDVWEDWFAQMLTASRAAFAEDWINAWLEAPVWQFALAPGLCGSATAIGLWMPSVDRVGRHFPLTIAALAADTSLADLLAACGGFLEAAIAAGLDAVTNDAPPEALMTRLGDAAAQPPRPAAVDVSAWPATGALWWTAGAPRVAAGVVATAGLPDPATFLAMLDGSASR